MDTPLNSPRSNSGAEPHPPAALASPTDDGDGLQRTRRQMRDFHIIAPFLEGVASWYGPKFHGKLMANGETYNQHGISAAHPNLPLGTLIEVENRENGRRLRMIVNDRGPYAKGRVLDLSRGAAERLDVVQKGTAPVRITVLAWPEDMPNGQGLRPYTQYVVQIASYPDFERAHALRKSLADRAPWAPLRLDRTTPTHLAVVAGPYDTHAEATRAAKRLHAMGRSDAMVRRYKK